MIATIQKLMWMPGMLSGMGVRMWTLRSTKNPEASQPMT